MDRTYPQAPAGGRVRIAEGHENFFERHGLLAYSVLAYAISWTLIIGAFFGIQAGIVDSDGALGSIANQVAAAAPLLAALIVVSLSRGWSGLAALGRSLFHWRVNPLWYLFLLAIPAIMVSVISIVEPAMPGAVAAKWQEAVPQLLLGIISIAIFTGLAEEPGWRGYAQPAANRRYQPLIAALIVSVIWALWHLPNALFEGVGLHTALHIPATIANGLVLAWVYNSTRGSVLLVMLTHAAQNAGTGVVQLLLEDTGSTFSLTDYYIVSAIAFGLLMAVVAFLTQGRIGLPVDPRGRHAQRPTS